MKVRKSTRSYLHEAAMTEEEMEMCLERGAEVVHQCHEEGSNVLSFGEWVSETPLHPPCG